MTDTILRRMPDYVNYIVPQFAHTHVNFQRVPMVDTSNFEEQVQLLTNKEVDVINCWATCSPRSEPQAWSGHHEICLYG